MRRMYTEHIYEEAIPDMYKAQLELEQVGMTFEKPFLNLADAETSVIHSFAKGGEKDDVELSHVTFRYGGRAAGRIERHFPLL